jgi:alanyl-tRNA synthetase
VVKLRIDKERRLDISRNHTATHLLHKALRLVLGEHAQQKGSLVEPGRLRFDFSHLVALSDDEIVQIEKLVNEAILNPMAVNTTVSGIEEAGRGAIALFGEKYGDEVRVVQIGDFSTELCGGAHVMNTGQIGAFKIISEGSVGSGLRRIEALTGHGVLAYLAETENVLKAAAAALRTTPAK